jgi:FMN reductase
VGIAVVTGNPKRGSRTLEAAKLVATDIAGEAPEVVIDVIELGPGLLGWGDPNVKAAVSAVAESSVAIFASPTFKASYTGLLKLFLDQFPSDGLAGVVAVPLMLGGNAGHTLAPELLLKPVLVELGATCPTRALYLIESEYANPEARQPWLSTARPILAAAMSQVSR